MNSYKSCFCVCVFFFQLFEADFFLLPCTIIDCMLIRDFILVARFEFDERRSIFDYQNFLIRIISNWTFTTENTAHITVFSVRLLNTAVILAKPNKISEGLVSVTLCNSIVLIAIFRSLEEMSCKEFFFKIFCKTTAESLKRQVSSN